jgi:hypothetical protein
MVTAVNDFEGAGRPLDIVQVYHPWDEFPSEADKAFSTGVHAS